MTFTGAEKEILKAIAQVNVTLDGLWGELADIRSQIDQLPLQIQGLATQQEEMVEGQGQKYMSLRQTNWKKKMSLSQN